MYVSFGRRLDIGCKTFVAVVVARVHDWIHTGVVMVSGEDQFLVSPGSSVRDGKAWCSVAFDSGRGNVF